MELPREIILILEKFKNAGYGAYIVGGCVRDLILENTLAGGPKDWDIATSAKPEQIQEIFPESFYENTFGTVGIKTDSEDPRLKVVEATTYRVESKYTDKRHPDEVSFSTELTEDLKRRDFTVNALAMDIDGKIVDLFGGREDIDKKIIKAVGDPTERFNEDALRMMRAIRFAATFGWQIEEKTLEAIKKQAGALKFISKERVRDELVKIIDSKNPEKGIENLRQVGLLEHIMPELLEGFGVGQNKHHIYDVWEHNILSLKYAADKNYSTEIRLASLLHDVGKPRSKNGEGEEATFYAHEMIGAKMTARILDRLKFPKDQAEKIIKLVRYHLFYYNVGEVTESSVRRLVAKIGRENVEDLIRVREADRIGSGVPKARPYKIRHLLFMVDKVSRDPISPKMLKLNGNDIVKILSIEPGPKIGMVVNALMNEVLDDPTKNEKEHLEKRVVELGAMPESDLLELSLEGKSKLGQEEEKEIKEIKKKHYVE